MEQSSNSSHVLLTDEMWPESDETQRKLVSKAVAPKCEAFLLSHITAGLHTTGNDVPSGVCLHGMVKDACSKIQVKLPRLTTYLAKV